MPTQHIFECEISSACFADIGAETVMDIHITSVGWFWTEQLPAYGAVVISPHIMLKFLMNP